MQTVKKQLNAHFRRIAARKLWMGFPGDESPSDSPTYDATVKC